MKRKYYLLLILLTLIGQPVFAYYPSMKLELKNIKMKRSEMERIKSELLQFFEDSPEALKTTGKKFKEDQYCKYEMDIDKESKEIKLDTIKVLDDKKNLAYNLKIIEFLRAHPKMNIEKKDENLPIEIGFKYLAF
jgi:hypothetical protein